MFIIVSIQQKNTTILNMNAPNNKSVSKNDRAKKRTRQILN